MFYGHDRRDAGGGSGRPREDGTRRVALRPGSAPHTRRPLPAPLRAGPAMRGQAAALRVSHTRCMAPPRRIRVICAVWDRPLECAAPRGRTCGFGTPRSFGRRRGVWGPLAAPREPCVSRRKPRDPAGTLNTRGESAYGPAGNPGAPGNLVNLDSGFPRKNPSRARRHAWLPPLAGPAPRRPRAFPPIPRAGGGGGRARGRKGLI